MATEFMPAFLGIAAAGAVTMASVDTDTPTEPDRTFQYVIYDTGIFSLYSVSYDDLFFLCDLTRMSAIARKTFDDMGQVGKVHFSRAWIRRW